MIPATRESMRLGRFKVATFFLLCAQVLLDGCPRLVNSDYQAASCGDDPAAIQACVDRCEEIIAPYRQALPVPPSTADAQCRRLNGQIGCACFARDVPGDAAVDLERGDFFINDNGCGAIGRPGGCLHDPAAFPGCAADTANGDAVCAVVCADLDDARRDDADGREDIEVLRAPCDSGCECAIAFDDLCTVVFGDDESLPDPRGATPLPFTDAAGCP